MRVFLIIFGLWWFTEYSYAIKISVDVKGSPAEITKITTIVPGVEKIINSAEFKAKILNATYSSTKDSSAQIYAKIMESKWDLKYELKRQVNWRGKCPVLGWTYPSTKVVWFNSCNLNGRSSEGIAGTICHEEMHKRGYGHKSARDINSVPYSVGNICAELYLKY